ALPAPLTPALALLSLPCAAHLPHLPPFPTRRSSDLPTLGPNVQLPTAASPLASVVWPAPVTLPPPDATANVTATFGTALPPASVTRTHAPVATSLPTRALCLLPALITTALALPAVPV